MVITLGDPVVTRNIQLCLALPTGEVIINGEYNVVATLEHSGTYSCVALLNGAPTIVSLPVVVYGK